MPDLLHHSYLFIYIDQFTHCEWSLCSDCLLKIKVRDGQQGCARVSTLQFSATQAPHYETKGRKNCDGLFRMYHVIQIGSDFDEDIDGDVEHRSVINLRKTYCVAIAAEVWTKCNVYSIF
jgi:hypothetical protein